MEQQGFIRQITLFIPLKSPTLLGREAIFSKLLEINFLYEKDSFRHMRPRSAGCSSL